MTRRGFLIAAAALAAAAGLRAEAGEARRIVVAGGDLTEIVFALGAGDRVVGADDTSTHPEAAAALPRIGYVRRLAPEGILTLAPDLVLAAADAGPEVALEQLAAAGVRIARAPAADTPEGIAAKIAFVGREIGREAEAAALAAAFRARLAEVRARVAALPDRPRVMFILSVRDGAPLVGGRGTSADEMLRLAGAENAAAGVEGWKPMNPEAILAAAPEAVLMMEQHAGRLGGIGEVLARPDLALTPAGRAGRAVTMEGQLLLGFGPRTPEAAAALAKALQPEAAAAAGL